MATSPLSQATQDLIQAAADDSIAAKQSVVDQTLAAGALALAQDAKAHADTVVVNAERTAKVSAHDALVSVAKDLGFTLPEGF